MWPQVLALSTVLELQVYLSQVLHLFKGPLKPHYNFTEMVSLACIMVPLTTFAMVVTAIWPTGPKKCRGNYNHDKQISIHHVYDVTTPYATTDLSMTSPWPSFWTGALQINLADFFLEACCIFCHKWRQWRHTGGRRHLPSKQTQNCIIFPGTTSTSSRPARCPGRCPKPSHKPSV